MKIKIFGLLSVFVLVLSLVSPVTAISQPNNGATHGSEDGTIVRPEPMASPANPAIYIIKLEGDALSTYRGDISGLDATSPEARGESKLDAKSPASQAYLNYLAAQQANFISTMDQALGHPTEVVYQYMAALNGLAVRLTAQEAKRVSMLPGVVFVQKETIEQPDTDAGPEWIGAPSIWDGTATPSGVGTLGEGVIVGILDTGINHDHPSFADVGDDGYDHVNPWGSGNYVGYCVANPDFCNDKLIGAWSYTQSDPGSPEDNEGHGSHTSSTAAGNKVHATRETPSGFLIEKDISGVAPHANIIMYDVCVNNGCGSAGSIAAVNQAILDGVDVINYSISGGNNPYGDSVELAFLDASSAGIFVSTSAGNSGPGAATVAHRSPWLATVAASTHNRLFSSSLIDMSGGDTTPPADMVGQSISTGYGPALIVYAGDFGDPLCQTPFPSGTWDGEIVVCDRGINARVDKGANVLAGGAGGFVLANDEANGDSLVADPHYLPAVHITYNDGVILKAWLATGSGQMATITETTTDLSPENGDIMASFSSRGPNTTFDVLKPDVTAPGVAIFAAYTDPTVFEFLGGTSMSSPHNAGAGALLSALFPDWSPAEMRSAIMTTASTANLRKEDGSTPADAFDVGAGRDDLTRAALAGIVLDETTANFQAANPTQGGDPKTLNQASLMNSECLGTCAWTRTVKSTLDVAETWTLSADAPAGMAVTFEPATFELAAGATQEVVISVDVTGLPPETWAFAQVNLAPANSAIPAAHFPVSVVPFETPPDIAVDPAALDKVQRADLVKTSPLNLSNNGQLPLEWEIYEDGSGLGTNLANWSDNFDSYPTDTSLHGLGGWKGWGNLPAATAYTRDIYALSAPNSVEIVGASDLVHEYADATSGVWHYTAMQYIPSSLSGETYFILLNQYDDGGTTLNWSTEVVFNGATDQLSNDGPVGGTLPIIYDQWVEIRVEIDLDTDTQAFYYGGTLLFQDTWTGGMTGGGILNIGAVDLFANNASEVYYDDLSLTYQVQPWSDNFDSYPTDASMHGLGGWKGWANDPAATAYTRDIYALSTPNSVEIVNISDLVHEYAGYDTGVWYYTAWQYIPTEFTGESYFILLNQYDDAGTNNNWSTQVDFNGLTDQVVNIGTSGGSLPLVRGEWMEIRVEIDLVNNVQSFFYGGDLLYEGTWTEENSGGGILNIAAVDLWGNNSSEVYYDDLSLANALPEICDQVVDMPWVSVDPTTGTTPGGSTSPVGVTFDSTGFNAGDVATGTLCVTSNDPDTPLVTVPLTMTVVTQDVAISPLEQTQTGQPGEEITYTFTVTNTGLEVDSFSLTLADNLWPTTVVASIGPLNPGEATTVDVVVTIPTSLVERSDTFTLTVTSVSNPAVWVQAQGTTIVETWLTYLPLVFKDFATP